METDNEMCLSVAIDTLKNSRNLNGQERRAFDYVASFIDRIVSISMGCTDKSNN